MPKPKSADYKNGYGDAKADMVRLIKEAMAMINDATKPNPYHSPTDEEIKTLRLRMAELKRLRAYIKALKPSE